MILFQPETQKTLEATFPMYRQQWLTITDSTSLQCQKLWQQEPHRRWLVGADEQSEGRGRYGRKWESAKGVNIYLSFVWDNLFASAVGHLNLFWGVMVWKTISALYQSLSGRLTLKWPNDVYAGDKKLAGILIQNLDPQLAQVVVGIGINVYATSSQIPETATSLINELGTLLGRQARLDIVSYLLTLIESESARIYEQRRDLLIAIYAQYARLTRERPYLYNQGDRQIAGKLYAIQSDGTAEIIDERGEIIHLIA